MKKAVAVLAVLMVLSGALFAAEGRIGLSVAPEWMWNIGTDANDGTASLALMAEGANYFGKEGGFGIEYGLGTSIPLSAWAGDIKVDADSGTAFLFKAGLGYKYAFGDLFGLTAGLGVRGTVAPYKLWGDSVKATLFKLDMYGSVGAELSVLEFLGINAGVMLGGPVYSSAKIDSALGSAGHTYDPIKAFSLAPYVIVSFLY